MAAHRTQHAVVAGLHRHVQVRTDLGRVRERIEQRVADVDHLDARQPHALDARDARDGDHQLAELEPLFGVAIVADADPGHHHLGLTVGDSLCGLTEDRARRPRASAAAHGRDDAVGAVAVTAILDLDEAARTGLTGGLAREHVVLEVGAAAELGGDPIGGPDQRRHAWVDVAELLAR